MNASLEGEGTVYKGKANTWICFFAEVYINIMQDTSWQRDLPKSSGTSPKNYYFEVYALSQVFTLALEA